MPAHGPTRLRRLRGYPRPEPLAALEDIRYIRETMERSSAFTAVPGWGGVAMGCTALAAAWLAGRQALPSSQLAVWLGEGVLAASMALVATQRKAQRAGAPLTSGPGGKFARTFLPAIIAGAALTAVLAGSEAARLLPGIWLLLYGAGVVTAGASSVRVVRVMGTLFMVTGGAALFLPQWGNVLMAAGFGGLHIVFGIVIAKKYGG
ncbi:MAG TPA: hypothetical protein VKW06_09895 [Candidatus Angelobacter sp.]|nr:hypothetical protein [Candidatus Angelobacter sp.]